MRKLLSIGILFTVVSCHPLDHKFIKENWWSHESGVKIGKGDFIIFDGTYYDLHEDTIYREGVPKAIIEKVDKKNELMHLRMLFSDSISIYYHHDYLK